MKGIFSKAIESQRLKEAITKGSQLMNLTETEFAKLMVSDFLKAFSSGYYGDKIMIAAAQEYFNEVERELT